MLKKRVREVDSVEMTDWVTEMIVVMRAELEDEFVRQEEAGGRQSKEMHSYRHLDCPPYSIAFVWPISVYSLVMTGFVVVVVVGVCVCDCLDFALSQWW